MSSSRVRSAGLFLFVCSTLATACTSTLLHVSHAGANVAGAEIYANGDFLGTTDSAGSLHSLATPAGTRLVARQKIFERPSYRQEHGPENGGHGWTQRVYLTNVGVHNDGTTDSFVVADAAATQELVLDDHNVVEGLHVLVSLDWDASTDELNTLKSTFTAASQFLYNMTDGQIFFEQVDIADNSATWASAEYHYQVDITIWPHTTFFGGFLGAVWGGQPTIEMSRRTDQNCSDAGTFAHEFGHLGFALMDEYAGVNGAGGNFCTGHVTDPASSFFMGKPQAACAMDNQRNMPKLCSGHPDNPHRNLNWQIFSPCWNSVLSGYGDNQQPPRWTLQSPDTRGAIPGTVPPIPVPSWVRVNVSNTGDPGLCQPIPVTVFYQDLTTPAAGATVWLRPRPAAGLGDFTEGKSLSDGSITIVGAHPGDQIWTPTQVIAVDSTNCVPAL